MYPILMRLCDAGLLESMCRLIHRRAGRLATSTG